MEQSDGNAAGAEEFEDLHSAIEEGDLEAVRKIVENHAEERYFSYDDTSALYKAFDCEEYEIISFLIYKGAKFVGSEEGYVYNFDIDLDRLNYLLLHYNKKSEKSCIYRLISFSQSPQVLDGERVNAIMSMYEHFFCSDINKLLMIILEREPFDIVYDFESDKVNKIHRLYNEESEVFGLTLSNSKEIFVGAKYLLSGDPRKSAKVYGVVAEELCHLAMTNIFKNDAKPYREEDSKLIKEFQDVVRAVKEFILRCCHIESVIQDVFEYYDRNSWECELIARVPHIIGIYGEELGRRIFQESSELYRLLKFYEQNVHKKCKLYSDPSMNTKPYREMEALVTKDFISFKEKQIHPLNESFQSFQKYLIEWENIFIILTNCSRLCMLHVYHELKEEYEFLLDKKCLFFSKKCFEKNVYKIRDTLKGNLWEYLILVMDKRELNMSSFQDEYLDLLEEFTTNGMKLIMISSSQFIDEDFDFKKAVNYKWSDLSEEYKKIQEHIKYFFKGEEDTTYVRKECFPKVFDEDDIIMILSGEVIEVDDGDELFSQGYVPDTYIEREFYTTVVDEKIFKNLSPDTIIILTGWKEGERRVSPFNKDTVKWIHGSDDEIQSDKSIFIIDKEVPINVEDFARKTFGRKIICLHYDEKVFYLRNVNSSDDVFSGHMKKKTLSEKEILQFLKRKRILLISDNAGYGKSTVISSLIDKLKKIDTSSWNWRVNFNKFVGNKNDCLSLANIEEDSDDEDVLDHLFLMLGLKNSFEKHLFWEFSKGGHCYIYFDGFDEIPSDYVNKALKLLFKVTEKTSANIVISTRKHHQKELELLLNTYSYQLVSFSRKDQLRYLENLWKCKLKYPNGRGTETFLKDKRRVPGQIKKIIEESKKEKSNSGKELKDLILALEEIDLRGNLESVRRKINDLEFSKLAESVIDKTALNKETVEFMGVPLHLFMIGIIYLDGNFDVEIQTDIYSIYTKFIEQKILLYVEEKQGFSPEGRVKKYVIKRETTEAYRIHIDLANQLLDSGKYDNNLNEEDLELCAELGIVFINGAEIDFLHQTFAEFFKAESIRVNLNKVIFTTMLFEERYRVVRRFVSSALATKKFENLSKVFIDDVEFLVTILEQFLHKSEYNCVPFFNHELNSDKSCVAKIFKILMELFEESVGEDWLNALMVILECDFSPQKNWYRIGGFLTLKALKMLLKRNSKENFMIIFGMVEYNSNPEEVIDVLKEYITIQTAGVCDGNVGENVKEKADSLLRLIKIKQFRGRGLLHYAVWNVRAEIFAKILKFLMDILGREKFINDIVKGKEYTRALDEFFRYLQTSSANKFCELLKEFHFVFSNEIEILFDFNLKFKILTGDWRNSFEVVSTFVECFGVESLEEVLVSSNSHGNYVIHSLARKNANAIENLKIIRSSFDDDCKMKEILRSENRMLKNIFHFATENEFIDFAEFLQFCNSLLEKEEIMDLLFRTDVNGENAMHLLFKNNAPLALVKNLNLIKNTLADGELFKQYLKSVGKYLKNIFHFAASNEDEVNVSFVTSYLDRNDIKALLTERDAYGQTCLHYAANLHSRNLPFYLEFSYDMLQLDGTGFEELMFTKDENGNTFLHSFVTMYSFHGEEAIEFTNMVIKSVKDKISDEMFTRLLRIRNKRGETCLHAENCRNEETMECFKNMLDENLFEELVQ